MTSEISSLKPLPQHAFPSHPFWFSFGFWNCCPGKPSATERKPQNTTVWRPSFLPSQYCPQNQCRQWNWRWRRQEVPHPRYTGLAALLQQSGPSLWRSWGLLYYCKCMFLHFTYLLKCIFTGATGCQGSRGWCQRSPQHCIPGVDQQWLFLGWRYRFCV